jgi:hypothetical protein
LIGRGRLAAVAAAITAEAELSESLLLSLEEEKDNRGGRSDSGGDGGGDGAKGEAGASGGWE